MKNLSRIIFRYLVTAVLMLLVTLFLNVFVYIVCGFQIVQATTHSGTRIRAVAEELEESGAGITLSDAGYEYLSEHYVWAMVLDDSGQVIWNWQLPDHLNHIYTAGEIAVFSKWYLDDYPVTERITDCGLLVAAQEKYTVWKQNFSDSVRTIEYLARMVPVTLITNLLLIFVMVLFFGFRFYRSLRILENGIQLLSEQKPIHLPEKGITELLSRQLNRTSDLLLRQQEHLNRRDDARAAWISGVSHDIRTPLSLIMGYASSLKDDPSLSGEQKHLAKVIENQSLQIKRLIEDLNLTSRLEYHMQPLRNAEFKPSGLLRSVVSDFYNQGLSDRHTIDLYIDPNVEQITLTGDTALLTRAFSNLIGNSIRHNPEGCTVTVTAYPGENGVCFQISDDGCGIPKPVILALTGTPPDTCSRQLSPDAPATEKAPHIMGLRIVWQIFKAHQWSMIFTDENTIHILTMKTTLS